MKRILAALAFVALATLAPAQATTLGIQFIATIPSAAATVTISPTTGAETAGPVNVSFYYTSATITAGVASCPAFSASTWILANTAIAVTSSAANAATTTVTSGFTPGSIQCIAATDAFQAGGGASAATVAPPLVIIILGTPSAPTSVAATVVL
jgi:hypothetical protein